MAVSVQWCAVLSFLALFLVCSCQDSANDLLTSAKKNLPELRKAVADFLPNASAVDLPQLLNNASGRLPDLPFAVNSSSLPSIEQGDKMIEEKCLKNGGNGSYAEYMVAKEELQACFSGTLDWTKIHDEIEKAKPTGDLDKLFRKYCSKTPIIKNCISNFTSSIEPCLEEEEKETRPIIMNVFGALEQFICYKEGDRIALFIGEGGKECLLDKREAITQCGNATFAKHLTTAASLNDVTDIETLPMMKFEKEECLKINEFQKCVVAELTKCKEPTPANIVDSLINFVRLKTPCREYKPEEAGAGVYTTANALTVVTSLLFVVTLSGWQHQH